MKTQKPSISVQELDELIKDWGTTPVGKVDPFFPFRFWFLFVMVSAFAYRLLFDTENMANYLTKDPLEVERLITFLYFRGWFVLVVSAVYIYAYLKGRYYGILSFAVLLTSSVNFVFDLFNIYRDVLSTPTPRLTILMILRVLAFVLLYMNLANYKNLPAPKDRLNVFLPFKKR